MWQETISNSRGDLRRVISTPKTDAWRRQLHANVDTMLNVDTQVLDGAVRAAAQTVGDQLITIVHNTASSPA